ncbi:PAS domain S-box protein [Oryzomonas sagensis]|uniref:histidine kinase n=1 Tax=Oryzomonas sagensis TaxID=2603857 RepID=A0ABQ6TPS9_9BACT|nr:PAS domain S-box protein [Oryzomonas sagensis]KAB0671059.1 PAS domain S-box protein [Oryzomonas sagensis]
MRTLSLKTKVSLVYPIISVCVLAGILLLSQRILESHVKEGVSEQQYQIVSVLADEIDRQVASTSESLVAIARMATPGTISSPQKALEFLRGEGEHLATFDNGFFIFDRHGRMMAELPRGLERSGKEFSYRDYLTKTFSTRKPFVSDPYVSSQEHHHPALMFTAPLFDEGGVLIAVLGGSIDLTRSPFLGKLSDVRIGKNGYLYVVNTDRVTLYHSAPQAGVNGTPPPGANPLLDRAIAGFDGTAETMTSRGVRTLASFKHLKSKNWIIAANYPISQAYEPIQKANALFLGIVVPIALLAALLLRRVLSRLTAPMLALARHVETLSTKTGDDRLFPAAGGDEPAVLAQAFNRLLKEVDQQQEELAKREVLYRTVVDFSSEMVFWVAPDCATMHYVSPSCSDITGYSPEEFYAAPGLLSSIIHPDDREHWDEQYRRGATADSVEPLEFRIVTRDGEVRWTNYLSRPVFGQNGAYVGLRGSFSDITLLKRAERSTVVSEEKFRLFFEQSSDAIFIIHKDGRIFEVNGEACSRYGFRREEFIGMQAGDLDTPEYAVRNPERFALVMALGQITFETCQRCKNGVTLPVEVKARLIDFDGDKAIMAVARDISDRKRADELLRRQNEYLTAFHETSLGLVRRLDVPSLLQAILVRAGKLVGTEHCYVYLLNGQGTAMDMVCQSGVFEGFVHCSIGPHDGIAGWVWTTGEPLYVGNYSQWEHRLPDADRIVLRAMVGVPLKSNDRVVGVLGLAFLEEGRLFDEEHMAILTQFAELASVALDNAQLYDAVQRELAERQKAEASLRKLTVGVEQNPASIIITDTGGTIEYVNPRFSEVTGYSSVEAVGQNTRMFKSGTTSPAEYRLLWETILGGREWRGEFHNRKKSGELYWEQAVIAPIRDEKGLITHFIAINEDITDRKRLESELHHSQKMEAIGQLAGGIAHDFNNILTAVIGYASIMQIKLPEESPFRNGVEQILATAERGSSLTKGLLAFSRKQHTITRHINLNEIVERVQKLLQRLISEDIRLTTRLAGEELPVMVDSVQIEQVLMSLAANARDAMPGGGEIAIGSALVDLDSSFAAMNGLGQPGRFALLTVSDTGQGMDEETISHIFEPFFTTKGTGKGTGLGLSIAYGIVKKHNGCIVCTSEKGRGTSFRIYLPCSDVESGDDEQEAPRVSPPAGQQVVLLADDNESTRRFSREVLEEFGYSVIEAEDGRQALDRFYEYSKQVGLLILDVIMPEMKGREVYEAIRAGNPGVKVLFTSGYTEEIVRSQEVLDESLPFIAKPYMPKELLMKIREVLGHGE